MEYSPMVTDESSDNDLILPDYLPKIPTIQERVNEIWKEFHETKIPIFSEDLLEWMTSLYQNLIKFIELKIDFDISELKKIKQNITHFLLMKTPTITNTESSNDENISHRSVLSKEFRKGLMIITSALSTIIIKHKYDDEDDEKKRDHDRETKDKIKKLKPDFFILKDYLPDNYSLYEIRLAICLYRSQLCDCLYSKSQKLYFRSLVHRIQELITWNSSSSKDLKRLLDYDLFIDERPRLLQSSVDDNNDENTQPYSFSDYFFDFIEKFIYFNKRKFYFCKKKFYSRLGCEVSPPVVMKFLSLIKEKISLSTIKESLDSVFAKSFPGKLILTSDSEHFKENNQDRKYVSSVKILHRYRIQHLMPHWKSIRSETGFCDKYLGIIDHYFEYNRNKKTCDPFIEEFSCITFIRLMEEKISLDLTKYIIREEDISIPLSTNSFYRMDIPYIIKTFRGWNIWDFIDKKMINYKSFIDCGIAFLFIVRDLISRFGLSEEESFEPEYDLLRKASASCKKFFEKEMEI